MKNLASILLFLTFCNLSAFAHGNFCEVFEVNETSEGTQENLEECESELVLDNEVTASRKSWNSKVQAPNNQVKNLIAISAIEVITPPPERA